MFFWKSKIRNTAQDVKFSSNTYELSEEIQNSYKELKNEYKNFKLSLLQKNISKKKSLKILQNFLQLYLNCETHILSLFNEIFKPDFLTKISKKRPMLILFNKVMKIFISLDMLCVKYREVFCKFSLYKMENNEKLIIQLSDIDTQRISILSCISLPMGRLILSIFSTNALELYYPTILSKRTRINLCEERKNILYFMANLTQYHNLKYISFYLSVIYRKFFNNLPIESKDNMTPEMIEYMNLLLNHK